MRQIADYKLQIADRTKSAIDNLKSAIDQLGRKDSNLGPRLQRPVCYRCTTPQRQPYFSTGFSNAQIATAI